MVDVLRFSGFTPIHRLRAELDRAFQQMAGELATPFGAAPPTPAVNVFEEDERFLVEAELPGVRMEDVELLVHGAELTLKGERRPADLGGAKEPTFHRRERPTGRFARRIRLPVAVDAANVEATLADGVLRVVLPKAQEARPRRIEVRARG